MQCTAPSRNARAKRVCLRKRGSRRRSLGAGVPRTGPRRGVSDRTDKARSACPRGLCARDAEPSCRHRRSHCPAPPCSPRRDFGAPAAHSTAGQRSALSGSPLAPPSGYRRMLSALSLVSLQMRSKHLNCGPRTRLTPASPLTASGQERAGELPSVLVHSTHGLGQRSG